ncbi:MAG: hypothetical protein ACKVW3_16785 [Phycisphaerales bacterium]
MTKNRIVALCSVIVAAAGVSVLADDDGDATSQGWSYGGYNCGCYANVNATLASCTACCNAAVIPSGPLNPAQVTNCIAFCNQAVFPCIPPV